jgi:hypothetical protein
MAKSIGVAPVALAVSDSDIPWLSRRQACPQKNKQKQNEKSTSEFPHYISPF